MKPPTRVALLGGLLVGLVNLVWLYAAYYLGLHTNGIAIFQIFVLIWFLLTLAGYVFVLRAVRKVSADWSYWKGMKVALIASLVSAAVAVLAQVGYYTVVHPAWPAYMADQTRNHFAAQGLDGPRLEERVDRARQTFTLQNYAIQSAITAVVVGVLLSAVILVFLRGRRRESAELPPQST